MNVLCNELLYEILLFVADLDDIFNLSTVCIKFYDILNSDIFWKKLLKDGNKNVYAKNFRIKSLAKRTYKKEEHLLHTKCLNLAGFELDTIPCGAFFLDNLTVLWLHENNIQYIDKRIINFQKMKQLHFANNYIQSLPKEICFLQNLEILDFHKNRIKIFPREILSLKNLKELVLSDNEIENLPQEMYHLKMLKILRLDKNAFKEFPVETALLVSLEYLFLERNNLQMIPHIMFSRSVKEILI